MRHFPHAPLSPTNCTVRHKSVRFKLYPPDLCFAAFLTYFMWLSPTIYSVICSLVGSSYMEHFVQIVSGIWIVSRYTSQAALRLSHSFSSFRPFSSKLLPSRVHGILRLLACASAIHPFISSKKITKM